MTSICNGKVLNIITRHCKKSSFLLNFKCQQLQIMSTENCDPLFKGKLDHFNGITINSQQEKCDVELFPQKLKDSLEAWKNDNRKTIWFKVSLDEADWVPILAKNGFIYHHAINDYVMMYKWLPLLENCNVPPYAHTMIGVGAIVINDAEEILVVSEKYRKVAHFKLPGGYVEPTENLVDAAIREVYEETGIKTKFDTMIGLRHVHQAQFGCSDIYNVFSLKPLNTDIIKSEQEIEKCEWMKVNDYLKHPHVHDLNKFVVQKYVEYKCNNISIDCKHGIHQTLQVPYTIYYVTKNQMKSDL